MNNEQFPQNDGLQFDLPKNQSSVIKVIGVGGGGSNAVNYMFQQGIEGVDFIVSNTDSQALENSPVPKKIQLGITLTEGLGAGANPEIGEQAAQETLEDIQNLLRSHTKMVFITAGMGGGTGTGAAPVIAKAAKDMGILTVGIVTIPFSFEGKPRLQQAEKGVDSLRQNVDSLVVINNNKLREVYGNLGFKAGFAKADEVLATAARGIAEVITHHYTANIDLRDAKTVLANSGTAIMGAAQAKGEQRSVEAISAALDSPLLNDNHIRGAKNVLLLIVSGQEEITIDEIGEINDFIQQEAGHNANIIMGIGEDEALGNEIAVTVVATGFNPDQQDHTIGRSPEKVIHPLEDEQAVSSSVYQKPVQIDEEEDDQLLDQELRRAEQEEQKRQKGSEQRRLFEEEDQPLPRDQNNSSRSHTYSEPSAPSQNESSPENSAEDSSSDSKLTDQPLFEIDGPGEEESTASPESPSESKPQDAKASQPQGESSSSPDSPGEEEGPVKRYSLEDYQRVEQRLNQAQAPQNKKPNTRDNQKNHSGTSRADKTQESHEEALQFQVKKRDDTEKPASTSRPSSGDPMDSPIHESKRLRAEERRSKLRAFNHRFNNHTHNLGEADYEPAYKRLGVNLSNDELPSKRQDQSRYRVDDSEDGPDLKSDNSFLHDNVD